MEETNRTPDLTPGPVWAERPQGAPTRAELAAVLQVCRRDPARRIRRVLLALLGLFCLILGAGAGALMLYQRGDYSLAALGLPLAGALLLGSAFLNLTLPWRLRRRLARLHDTTLFPEFAHFADPDDPWDLMVADLHQVERMEGWIVLVWGKGPRAVLLPLPDEACAGGADALFDRLREAAPGARFRSTDRSPRMPHRLLPAAALLLLVGLSLVWPIEALQGWVCYSGPKGASLYLRYDADTHQIINRATGQSFARPAAGAMASQWLSSDCCAVSYSSTDGTTRVELLFPRPDKARRLDPDPPTGCWREITFGGSPVTLSWDEERSGYLLENSDGAFFYNQWEDYDGLGLVLCDDSGLPQWALAPTEMPWFDSEGGVTTCPALSLCPVSMDQTEPLALLSTEVPAGDTTGETTPPTFSDTIDVCVNKDGVFFTWDGGSTYSQALTPWECEEYEIGTTGNLQPLVLRQDVASFFTDSRGMVEIRTTTDQGQNWQTCLLDSMDFAPIYARCLGFTDTGMGYAAVSSDSTPATGDPTVGLYTTRDGGQSWQAIAVPKAAGDSMRQVNGLCFYDDSYGLVSTTTAADNNWPHVFATTDGGQSWQELSLPFEDSCQGYAVSLTDLTFSDSEGLWQATFTQAPSGSKEIVLEAPDLTGPWRYFTARDLY